ENLIPNATVVTPNLVEAGHLAGIKTPRTLEEIKEAARLIHQKGANNVVVKGGTGIEGDNAIDVFYDGQEMHLLESQKFDSSYNQGAGCTFASAIVAIIAIDYSTIKDVFITK